jgi:archaetidylinositol phosphate synthase
MTLEQLRPIANRLLEPFVTVAERAGLTPDAVSGLALAVAVGAGLVFAVPGVAPDLAGVGTGWYLVGALLVFVNGWLDLVDGALARRLEAESAAGDLLDHVFDRYADIAIIVGLAAGIGQYALGLAAVTGVLMTSYLGTQAQAVGIERMYAGVLGRADRLMLVGVVGGLVAVLGPAPMGVPLVAALLGLLAVVGHLTAVQRLYVALGKL